jgi:O-antigen ligase
MSAHGRIDGLVNGIKMMIDRPLLGVGIGQYPVALGSIYGKGWWEAHSLPGQLFGDLGVLGTLAFGFWLWTLFKNFRRLDRHTRDSRRGAVFLNRIVLALKMEIFCLLFMGLGGHNLYRYNWFFASAMVVVMLKLIRDQRSQLEEVAPETAEESGETVQTG